MKKRSKKGKYGNRRNLYINLHLKEDFGMEFVYSLLMRADARGSANTLLHVTHIATLRAGDC